MGSLYVEIKKIVDTILVSYGLADYRIGTVVSLSPLKVKISDRITLGRDQIILTRAVVLRTIDCSHVHDVTATVGAAGDHTHSVTGETDSAGETPHSHAVTGSTDTAGETPHSHAVTGSTDTAGGHSHAVSVSSDAVGLPAPIVIVEGLKLGDKVILLSVERGQRYIMLSKVVD